MIYNEVAMNDQHYRLEKEYSIPIETFRAGYLAYQKKYVYLKSYVFIALFLLLAADFIHAAIKTPDNIFAYVLIMVCLGFAFREWYNPRKIRRSVCDSMAQMQGTVYKLAVADSFIDISTVSEVLPPQEENPEEAQEEENTAPPEPTRIPIDGSLSVLEYDSFFLLVYGKAVFYIVPKDGFTEPEQDIMRNISENRSQQEV